MSAPLAFWKMEGAGNDFVVLDGREQPPPLPPPELARVLCDRRRGVGADGLLVVRRVSGGRVLVGYWNADGSPAAFCGNGARCVARLAAREGWVPPVHEVVFPGLAARAEVPEPPGPVRLELPGPARVAEFVVRLGERRLPGSAWKIGVVHLVVAVPGPDPGTEPLEEIARAAGEVAGIEDPNLTLVAGEGDELRVRTRERGAGETLACGSAAIAAAAWWGAPGRPVRIVPPGGDVLVVRPAAAGRVVLEGPAREVFSGAWPASPA